MATHAPLARQPFGELNSSRLQQLASSKNRQNGMIAKSSPLSGKPDLATSKNVSTPITKRTFALSNLDDFDSENIDPAAFKKSKSDGFEKPAAKPFTFSISAAKAMPPPPTIPSRLTTPARANMSSPRAPLTAPAGRSPKRKIAGISKSRRTSAPFTRIDPPFGTRTSSSATLPFSLDAALNGTFASSSSTAKPAMGATIKETMPNDWFFDIYVDTPEEEASNLMEHSTLNLDLSSDEETSAKDREDRGKENTPPEGYEAPTASRSSAQAAFAADIQTSKHTVKTEIIRKKIVSDDMDDGERSPLSDLETDSFFPEGLNKDSHVIVDGDEQKENVDVRDSLVASSISLPKQTIDLPQTKTSKHEKEAKDDIIVWEDSDGVGTAVAVAVEQAVEVSVKGVDDENAAPQTELFA